MSDVLAERGRLGTKLATQLDSEGKLVEFDIREDEEQNIKLQETIELLLVAGYFRARIKGLSVFDKVVGGMVWCISQCYLDIDVDLLYSENSSIGQKISLTEKIVVVLPRMKCPHSIEPHQIQGLDFIHIFPVVQWLVKKTIEARSETEDSLKKFAVHQFNSNMKLPNELKNCEDKRIIQENFNAFQSRIYPERNYKRLNYGDMSDETSRVTSTLLEYRSGSGTVESGADKHDPQDTVLANLEAISPTKSGPSKLSSSAVASLIDTQHIHKIANEFAKKNFEPVEEQAKTTSADDLNLEIETLQKRLTALQAAEVDANVQMEQLKEELQEARKLDEERSVELEECERLEKDCPPQVLQKLNQLKKDHDRIKSAENEFKLKCKIEIEALDSEIARLQELGEKGPIDDTELRSSHANLSAQLKWKRLEAAEMNKKVAMLQRALDEQPSRAELNQYQKRFMELYNQVASKHRETKQFYTLYNTLVDVRSLMEWENSVLDSVSSQYSVALSSDNHKKQFIEQLETIVDKVHQRKFASERKQTEKRMERDILREQYQELLDQQRLYHKTVADFKQECRRNEELTQTMTSSSE